MIYFELLTAFYMTAMAIHLKCNNVKSIYVFKYIPIFLSACLAADVLIRFGWIVRVIE